jgi:acylphosphatase
MKKQVHVYYSGQVQGIGFRYTLADIANSQKVVGWVKNLLDARVEVLAEAKEDVLNSFLQQVNQHYFVQIKDVNIEWLPARGEFRDFRVRF